MKKLAILFLALVAMSCSDDDGNENTASLQGTWRLTSFDATSGFDLNNDGTASTSIMDETSCYQNETLEFNSGGMGVSTIRSYADIEFIIDVVAGTSSYEVTCVSETDASNFVYVQSENIVTITTGSNFIEGVISSNTLTVVIPEGFPIETEEGGNTVTVLEDITMVYTKQ